MLTMQKVEGEFPYRIRIDNLYGAGDSPARAAMAALSAGGKIPRGMRDASSAVTHLFWNYEPTANWVRLIHILEHDTFEEEP